jgi:hypothetical protein
MCERFFAKTICLFLLICPYFSQAEQHPGEFAASITSHVQIQYLLFTPEGYKKAEGKVWPSIQASREICRHRTDELSNGYNGVGFSFKGDADLGISRRKGRTCAGFGHPRFDSRAHRSRE